MAAHSAQTPKTLEWRGAFTLGLLAHAGIHLGLVGEHLAASSVLATGFLLSGLAQVVLALLVLTRPVRTTYSVAIALSVSLLLLYVTPGRAHRSLLLRGSCSPSGRRAPYRRGTRCSRVAARPGTNQPERHAHRSGVGVQARRQ